MINSDTPGVSRLLSVNEACALLGLSRSTLYDYLRMDRIRALKRGARTVITEAEIARFQASLPPAQSRAGREQHAAGHLSDVLAGGEAPAAPNCCPTHRCVPRQG